MTSKCTEPITENEERGTAMFITITLKNGTTQLIEIDDELHHLPEPARRAWEEADRA